MRIRRVFIENFGCIAQAEVEFATVTTFVGPNGTGKSTVLRALDWFFNGGAETLSLEDVYMHQGDVGVSVGVEFDSITSSDREALGKYAEVGDHVTIYKHWIDGRQKIVGRALVFPPFDQVRSGEGAKERGDRYRELRDSHTDLDLPVWGSDARGQATMDQWEVDNPDKLELADVDEASHFFGFAGQAKMSGLFDYVFVSADLRASEEASDSKNAAIGRIIQQAVSRREADEELATLVDRVSRIQEKIREKHFGEQLESLSARLTKEVGRFAPGRSIGVNSSTGPIQPQRVRFELAVVDQCLKTSVHKQGHGFQRAMMIAALKLLAESRMEADSPSDGVLCLAIEEPELYQHPLQARSFARVLRSLAEDPNSGVQVAYATHSSYFVEPRSFDQIRRVTRHPQSGGSFEAKIVGSSVDNLVALLEGHLEKRFVRKNLDATCIGSLSEALFADAVILVEGATDRAVLSGVAAREAIDVPLDGVMIVEVGGKGGLLLSHAILHGLGIPSFLLADNDSDKQKKLIKLENSDDPDPERLKGLRADVTRHKELNSALLRFFGCDPEDWPEGRYGERLLFVDGSLEDFLKEHWPEWMIAKDDLVQVGLGFGGKDQLTYQDAALAAGGTPPSEFIDALRDASQLAAAA